MDIFEYLESEHLPYRTGTATIFQKEEIKQHRLKKQEISRKRGVYNIGHSRQELKKKKKTHPTEIIQEMFSLYKTISGARTKGTKS